MKYWHDLQDGVYSIDTYRQFEVFAFYSQLLAIVIYVIYSKLFLLAKKYSGTFDKNDPFQKILAENNKDFLENENFFMVT